MKLRASLHFWVSIVAAFAFYAASLFGFEQSGDENTKLNDWILDVPAGTYVSLSSVKSSHIDLLGIAASDIRNCLRAIHEQLAAEDESHSSKEPFLCVQSAQAAIVAVKNSLKNVFSPSRVSSSASKKGLNALEKHANFFEDLDEAVKRYLDLFRTLVSLTIFSELRASAINDASSQRIAHAMNNANEAISGVVYQQLKTLKKLPVGNFLAARHYQKCVQDKFHAAAEKLKFCDFQINYASAIGNLILTETLKKTLFCKEHCKFESFTEIAVLIEAFRQAVQIGDFYEGFKSDLIFSSPLPTVWFTGLYAVSEEMCANTEKWPEIWISEYFKTAYRYSGMSYYVKPVVGYFQEQAECAAKNIYADYCKLYAVYGDFLAGLKCDSVKNQCPICLAENNRDLLKLLCGHIFDERCVKTWFNISFTCPVCRRPFSEIFAQIDAELSEHVSQLKHAIKGELMYVLKGVIFSFRNLPSVCEMWKILCSFNHINRNLMINLRSKLLYSFNSTSEESAKSKSKAIRHIEERYSKLRLSYEKACIIIQKLQNIQLGFADFFEPQSEFLAPIDVIEADFDMLFA